MSTPREIAEAVIKELGCRKGFRYWWDNIDAETDEEIMEELTKTIDLMLK